MRRLKKLIKEFRFSESNRKRIVLGTDTRLNPEQHWIQLKALANGAFSTAPNLNVKTWVANPSTVKQWMGFDVDAVHAKNDLGVPLTSVSFRLSDGVSEFWWNGSTWVVNTTNWNTEAQVAANIGTFPVTSKKLRVVINLVTTDSTVTPVVKSIKALWTSDIEFYEDIVWRSLVPQLRTNLRPIGDHVVKLSVASSSIDLNVFKIETPYNIPAIDSVYNHTDDPDHFTDIFSSYNPITKVITLTGTVAAGKDVWIRFLWEPEVAVTTGQEYSEIAKIPSVVLSDINLVDSAESGQDDAVLNKAAVTGTKVLAPIQADVDITLLGLTASAKDQSRLADELKRFFANKPILLSKGMDEEYRLWLLDEYDQRTVANQSEIHAGRLRFRIVKALFFEREAVGAHPVTGMSLVGDMNVVIS